MCGLDSLSRANELYCPTLPVSSMFFGRFPTDVDIFTEVPSRLADSIGVMLAMSMKMVINSAF